MNLFSEREWMDVWANLEDAIGCLTAIA